MATITFTTLSHHKGMIVGPDNSYVIAYPTPEPAPIPWAAPVSLGLSSAALLLMLVFMVVYWRQQPRRLHRPRVRSTKVITEPRRAAWDVRPHDYKEPY